MKRFKKESVNQLNQSPISRKLRKSLMQLEDDINYIFNDIQKKLVNGIDIFKIMIPDEKQNEKIIRHILLKDKRKLADNYVLRQFLIMYPKFLHALNIRENIPEINEVLLKVIMLLKSQETKKDILIYLNGQLGKRFYFLIQGEVAIFEMVEFEEKLTIEEFYLLLTELEKLNEFELIRNIFQKNKDSLIKIGGDTYGGFKKFAAYIDIFLPVSTDKEYISENWYIKRYNNILEELIKAKRNESINEEGDFYTFYLYRYKLKEYLKEGDYFGENILQKESKKRLNTAISTKDCFFATIEKEDFQLFLKETMDKGKKLNVYNLLRSNLFKKYRPELFELHHYNNFTFLKYNKGDYLFKTGEKVENLYFIKTGEVLLQTSNSLKELDKLAESMGGNPYDNKMINEMVKYNKRFQSCYEEKRFIKLSIFSGGDVIGIEDCFIKESQRYIFDAFCSNDCEIFVLSYDYFKKMLSETLIYINHSTLLKERKIKLIKRLESVKLNTIDRCNKTFVEDSDYLNLTDKNKLYKLRLNTTPNLGIVNHFQNSINTKNFLVKEVHTEYISRNVGKGIRPINGTWANFGRKFTSRKSLRSKLCSRRFSKFPNEISLVKNSSKLVNDILKEDTESCINSGKRRIDLTKIINEKKFVIRRKKNIFPLIDNDELISKKLESKILNTYRDPGSIFKQKYKISDNLKDRVNTYNTVIDKLLSQRRDIYEEENNYDDLNNFQKLNKTLGNNFNNKKSVGTSCDEYTLKKKKNFFGLDFLAFDKYLSSISSEKIIMEKNKKIHIPFLKTNLVKQMKCKNKFFLYKSKILFKNKLKILNK